MYESLATGFVGQDAIMSQLLQHWYNVVCLAFPTASHHISQYEHLARYLLFAGAVVLSLRSVLL